MHLDIRVGVFVSENVHASVLECKSGRAKVRVSASVRVSVSRGAANEGQPDN